MQQICLFGGLGNMGSRYRSICEFLGIPYIIYDVEDEKFPTHCSHYIICTPTHKHMEHIQLIDQKTPKSARILCEKPIFITFDRNELRANLHTLGNLAQTERQLFMVNQYAFYPGLEYSARAAPTMYDFFNSGPHQIDWDCIQIVHLAQSKCTLLDLSPIWKCFINGTVLNRERLDRCYVEMVQAFWRGRDDKLWSHQDIVESHRKVFERCVNSNHTDQCKTRRLSNG